MTRRHHKVHAPGAWDGMGSMDGWMWPTIPVLTAIGEDDAVAIRSSRCTEFCSLSVAPWPRTRRELPSAPSTWSTPSPHTVSTQPRNVIVQYPYSTPYSTRTVPVQHPYSTRTVPVQYPYSTPYSTPYYSTPYSTRTAAATQGDRRVLTQGWPCSATQVPTEHEGSGWEQEGNPSGTVNKTASTVRRNHKAARYR